MIGGFEFLQNATCSFLIPFFFFGGGYLPFCCFFFQRLLLPHHFKRQKCHLSSKAWEEMQEEGLEANAVGESQSQGVGARVTWCNGWTRPGDLWLYVGCLCEMWSPRKGTCVYGGFSGLLDCGILFCCRKYL